MSPLPNIILASQSKGRIEMLQNAGLHITAIPAHIDEQTIITDLIAHEETFDEIAQTLADEKALAISRDHPGALIIGSDQILEFHGHILSKAKSDDQAISRLKEMVGDTHHLISAVSIALDGEIIWQACDHAALSMHHDLDDAFFDRYKARAGKALTASVGGYWLEDIGSWLFEAIDGNYFTILGMPLLPLLAYLRAHHGAVFSGEDT
ncbi:MAG: septum formation protein Maf [Alphaproteobacteria bacterium]|nr:septum formation protein Maf [Alphaproteobacteria bacterium]|tara:strand:- start:24213 stop:24836 length:624 start_codon:yes stop_codon:yes gene_type:complete